MDKEEASLLFVIIILGLLIVRVVSYANFSFKEKKFYLPIFLSNINLAPILLFLLTLMILILIVINRKSLTEMFKEILELKLKKMKKGDKWIILTVFLIFVGFLLFLYLVINNAHYSLRSPNVTGSINRKAFKQQSERSGHNATVVPVLFNFTGTFFSSPVYSLFSEISIILFSFILLFMFYLSLRAVEELEKEKKNRAKAPKMRKIIEATIEKIRSMGDFRNAIIFYYYEMCKLFGKRGLIIEKHYTARDLENEIVNIFKDIPREPLHKITVLFEIAKYSNHKINDKMKEEALGSLITIKEFLRAKELEV